MFSPFGTAAALIGSLFLVFEMPMAINAAIFTEMYIPYNENADTDSLTFGDFGPYTFDDPLRQHLHLFLVNGDANNDGTPPSPVLLWAHANGGTADNLSRKDIQEIARAGYNIITWESVTKVSGEVDGTTCFEDFELVWEWYQNHAVDYNMDPNYAIVGGRSRGSACSWLLAHDPSKPQVRGIYMYNALPDQSWPSTVPRLETPWVTSVTEQSPPIFLGYGPECPRPITQDCVPSPDQFDKHNPRNGQTILDQYEQVGLASMSGLADGFHNKGIGVFGPFPKFATFLESVDALIEEPQSLSVAIESLEENLESSAFFFFGDRQGYSILMGTTISMLFALLL